MRASQFLTEAPKRYMPMIAGLASCYPEEIREEVLKSYEAQIRHIESGLKRQDRIIWYIRWWRIITAHKLTDIYSTDGVKILNDAAHALKDKYVKELGLPLAVVEQQCSTWMADGFHTWNHFANTPAPAVQAVVWDRQLPKELYDELQTIEFEWQKARSQQIKHPIGDEPEVFLDLAHLPGWQGWAWYDLQSSSCDAEANAMGHCGNAGGNYRDTILSLRKHVGDDQYRPSATFILDDDGMLGEMKGRANNKPADKYHPAIVELLKDSRIKGLKGGGYMPQENFAMDDLDPKIREKIQKNKPLMRDLNELYYYYQDKKKKLDPALASMLKMRLHDGLIGDVQDKFDVSPKVDVDKGDMLIASYKSAESYLSDYNSYCKWLDDLFDEELPSAMKRFLHLMPMNEVSNICGAAKHKLFKPMFEDLLPYDVQYTVNGSAQGGDVMEARLEDGQIKIIMPIDLYFEVFWGEDAATNRQHIEHIEDCDNGFGHDLSETHLLHDDNGDDPVVRAIYEYLVSCEKSVASRGGRYAKVDWPSVKPALVKLVFDEFKDQAHMGHTDKQSYAQHEMNLDSPEPKGKLTF